MKRRPFGGRFFFGRLLLLKGEERGAASRSGIFLERGRGARLARFQFTLSRLFAAFRVIQTQKAMTHASMKTGNALGVDHERAHRRFKFAWLFGV